ncbi:MAG TPA: phytoene desaturase family protein [Anaerolineales bacterium]|nr:phytoene desaturase family protein [Anaerolineales bacterium]
MKSKSVVIIGAGVGGIAAAIHLARQGFHVTVYEKNPHPGGRCDWIEREGHHFDTGPTLMVMSKVYEAEFAAIGTPMTDLLDLQLVDPSYRLVFDDGSQLALTSDMQSFRDQLESIEPGAYTGFLRYHREGEQHYRLAMDKLVNRDFRKITDLFNLSNVPLIYQVKPLLKHYNHLAAYFKSSRLKAAFSFQDVYMGLSPFDAPATFSLMPYTELEHGVWYPRGGMYSIVEALMTLAQASGVEFAFDTTVEQIVVEGQRVAWLELEHDQQVKADVILANADLPYVYQELLPKSAHAEKIKRKQFSCSVISFFWGIDKPYPILGPHTLFLADDYRQNFVSIIQELGLPANPSLYIHAPARLDPTMAPQGEDTLIAIVPVGHLSENGEQDWDALTDVARQHVFRRLAALGITDLQDHIKFETSFTPLSWKKRYNLMKGSTHGLSHNLAQLAYFRPSNHHPQYKNLYFVGASTHPGTGLPTAMISARLVARRIRDEMGELE